MDLTQAEKVILDRFHDKCRIAGGLRVGYMLRERSIRYVEDDHPGLDFGGGLAALVDKGLLSHSEDRRFYYLTEAGVESLRQRHGE